MIKPKFKLVIVLLAVVTVLSPMVFPSFSVNAEGTVVTFPDANLEEVIRDAIGKASGPIYDYELSSLTTLDASDRGIADLAGLEYCTSITTLHLDYNLISDIQPLVDNAGIDSGDYVDLRCNSLSALAIMFQKAELTARGVTVDFTFPSSVPELLSPAPNATNVGLTPEFQWSVSIGAESYNLKISTTQDFSVTVLSVNDITETSYQIDAGILKEDTVYYWKVTPAQCMGAVTGSGSEAKGSFTTILTGPIPTATPTATVDYSNIQLETPENGATTTDTTPLFTWSKIAEATNYELQVATNPAFGAADLVIDESLGDISAYEADKELVNGTYYWHVRGTNPATGTESPWSFGSFALDTSTEMKGSLPMNLTIILAAGGGLAVLAVIFLTLRWNNRRMAAVGANKMRMKQLRTQLDKWRKEGYDVSNLEDMFK